MEEAAVKNYAGYIKRVSLYKKFGYDLEADRQFLLDKSQPLSGNILEVGTGKGYLSMALARAGYNFVSLDISSQEQESARLSLRYLGLEKKADFRTGNAENLNFTDKSFDVVISSQLIHHLDKPFLVMDEFIRVVSGPGKIVLSDFNKKGLKVIEAVHQSEGRMHHSVSVGLKDIERYLRQKKFSVESYREEFQDALVAYHPSV